MNQPTFMDDGKRRILCAACKGFVAESHLGELARRAVRCKSCGSVSIVYPPRKGIVEDQKVILFGPGEGLFTADLTESEIEDSM